MVRAVLFKFSVALFFILFSKISYSVPKLVLITDKTETEIGRPLRLEIYAIAIKAKLSKIDLSPLQKDFGVITEYSTDKTNDSRWPNQPVQILNLKIYPRHTGILNIPILKLNKYTSKAKQLFIKPGESTSKPTLSISSKKAFTRQQFIIQFTIYSKDLTSRLTINPDDKIPGFDSNILKFQRIKQNNGQYRLTTGWALSALKDGNQLINLPPIDYSESGVSRKKYYLPRQQVKINKLPSYLPPTMPVGKVSIHSQLSAKTLIKTDSIIYWQLQLKGNLSNSYQLPPILRQVKSNNDVKIFPVNTKREQLISENNITSTVTHTIPIKIIRSGYISLPTIKTQYFDPATEKITNIILQQPTVSAANIFIQLLLYTPVFLFFVLLVNRLSKIWRQRSYCLQQRKRALEILQAELNPEKFRLALNLISKAEGWPENISLTQWKAFWSEKYIIDSEFTKLLQQVSDYLYANTNSIPEKIEDTASKLVKLVKNRQYNKKVYKFELPAFNL